MISFQLSDAAATRALGDALAGLLRPGDCLALRGALGAGKTTLVQGLAWALGLPRDQYAPSPTYAVALTYPTAPPLHHLDLYRLSGGAHALLGDSYFTPDAITVVEWPENAPEWLPEERFELALHIDAAARSATLSATAPELGARLQAWQAKRQRK